MRARKRQARVLQNDFRVVSYEVILMLEMLEILSARQFSQAMDQQHLAERSLAFNNL